MADKQINERSICRGFACGCSRVVLSVLLLVGLTGCGKTGETQSAQKPADTQSQGKQPATQVVEINGHSFELELALDDEARAQGLSDRKSIAEDGGMLFVFRHPVRTQFVMRRCYVPIDLIYVDDDGYIDTIHRMDVIKPIGGAQWKNPSTGYSSAGSIQFVIELKGGTLDKLDLRRGDRIDLPRERLESMAE